MHTGKRSRVRVELPTYASGENQGVARLPASVESELIEVHRLLMVFGVDVKVIGVVGPNGLQLLSNCCDMLPSTATASNALFIGMAGMK